MRGLDLNLSRRPFVNVRPIGRSAAVLWVLGALLLGLNAFLYWGYFTSSEGREEDFADSGERVADHRQAIADLKARLNALNLPAQNAQVEFLNRKIAERTFAWSLLFDRLAEVQPDEVRLVSLNPTTEGESGRRGRRRGEPKAEQDAVRLSIASVAKDGDSQLEFVDRLFDHPAFEDPDLSQDTRLESGEFAFNLMVTYLPGGGAPEDGSQPLLAAGATEGPGSEAGAGTRTSGEDALAGGGPGTGQPGGFQEDLPAPPAQAQASDVQASTSPDDRPADSRVDTQAADVPRRPSIRDGRDSFRQRIGGQPRPSSPGRGEFNREQAQGDDRQGGRRSTAFPPGGVITLPGSPTGANDGGGTRPVPRGNNASGTLVPQ